MTATHTGRRSRFASMYVALVIALTAIATLDPNEPRTQLWLLALALCLPVVVLLLPVLSIGWNVTDAESGGATWPLTVLYVVALGAVAAADVVVVSWWRRRRRLLRDRTRGRPGPNEVGPGATMR